MRQIGGEGAGELGRKGNKGKSKGEGQAAAPGGLARLWHIFTGAKPPAPKAFSLGQRTPPRAPVPQSLENQKPKPDISPDLQSNLDKLKAVFNYPVNSDVQFREFVVSTTPPTKAFIVYIEGLADKNIETETILKPLMVFARGNPNLNRRELLSGLRGRLIPGTQVQEFHSYEEVFKSILTATSALFLDGADFALDIETKGWEHRGVERPLTEITVRGPQDSFTETLRANTALVRRRIRTPRLIMESLRVGKLSSTDIVISYIDGITNPRLVAEVRRRIASLETDYVPSADILEQYIQDSPLSLFPQVGSTERPDRVAAFLSEGNVAIMVDNSPYVLVVPVFFTNFIHSPEDYYLRWPFGTFMRVVRVVGLGDIQIGITIIQVIIYTVSISA
jgi:spore germination protein KA